MNTWRKYLSYVLCLCISSYALPAFAYVDAGEAQAIKVELTDEQMRQAVGAGQIDATMADLRIGDTVASAVVANRSFTLQVNYTLDVINVNGGVIETLDSGVLAAGEAKIISGAPTVPIGGGQGYWVQARVWNSGMPGFEAIDTSAP